MMLVNVSTLYLLLMTTFAWFPVVFRGEAQRAGTTDGELPGAVEEAAPSAAPHRQSACQTPHVRQSFQGQQTGAVTFCFVRNTLY